VQGSPFCWVSVAVWGPMQAFFELASTPEGRPLREALLLVVPPPQRQANATTATDARRHARQQQQQLAAAAAPGPSLAFVVGVDGGPASRMRIDAARALGQLAHAWPAGVCPMSFLFPFQRFRSPQAVRCFMHAVARSKCRDVFFY
jgi:hypothetical protein